MDKVKSVTSIALIDGMLMPLKRILDKTPRLIGRSAAQQAPHTENHNEDVVFPGLKMGTDPRTGTQRASPGEEAASLTRPDSASIKKSFPGLIPQNDACHTSIGDTLQSTAVFCIPDHGVDRNPSERSHPPVGASGLASDRKKSTSSADSVHQAALIENAVHPVFPDENIPADTISPRPGCKNQNPTPERRATDKTGAIRRTTDGTTTIKEASGIPQGQPKVIPAKRVRLFPAVDSSHWPEGKNHAPSGQRHVTGKVDSSEMTPDSAPAIRDASGITRGQQKEVPTGLVRLGPSTDTSHTVPLPQRSVNEADPVATSPRLWETTALQVRGPVHQAVVQAAESVAPSLENAYRITQHALQGNGATETGEEVPVPRVNNNFNVNVTVPGESGLTSEQKEAVEDALVDILRQAARAQGLEV